MTEYTWVPRDSEGHPIIRVIIDQGNQNEKIKQLENELSTLKASYARMVQERDEWRVLCEQARRELGQLKHAT